jgi:hypothetical protein
VRIAFVIAVALALSGCDVFPRREPPPKEGVRALPGGAAMKWKTLPSGQRLEIGLAADQSVFEETHSHAGENGKTGILLKKEFDHGQKTGEVYILGGRVAGRADYETARAKYPDMPPADSTVPDSGMDRLRKSREEIGRMAEEGRRRAQLPEAERSDLQCEDAMKDGEQQDLGEWRRSGKPVVLGELNQTTSAAILDDLLGAGAVRVVGTHVSKDPQRGVDTNWIVAELPKEPAARRKLLSVIDRLNDKNGWDPSPDIGQRYQLLGKFKWLPWTRWP